MSALEDYDKRFGLPPLTTDQISDRIAVSEAGLGTSEHNPTQLTDRVLVWMNERLHAVYEALENPVVPTHARCAWCLRASGSTDEAWRALPKMDMEDSAAHAQICEHNPLVQRNRELEARHQEHLALIVKVTNETPFPDEVKGWPEQRAKLVAETGTLRARVNELEVELEDTRTRAKAMGDELTALHAKVTDLEATNVDLQGRKIGNADTWAEVASEASGMYDHMRKLHEAMKATIRSLLDTEVPAEELRKAVGELVR